MAKEQQLQLLRQDVEAWNFWRERHPEETIDLDNADLSHTDLRQADLTLANLRQVNLSGANLSKADLTEAHLFAAGLKKADMSGACLRQASLYKADLSKATLAAADLTESSLDRADLFAADLREAKLYKSDLSYASLTHTNLAGAQMHNCRIYGISIWNANLENTEQADLIITPDSQPTLIVDNLEVAQFIHLSRTNSLARSAIDTRAIKTVLILGRFIRFIPERSKMMDGIRVELRRSGYIPIMCDIDTYEPASSFMEIVSSLASMARFVIADITDDKAYLADLYNLLEKHPAKLVQPTFRQGKLLNGLIRDFMECTPLLPAYEYPDGTGGVEALVEKVIAIDMKSETEATRDGSSYRQPGL